MKQLNANWVFWFCCILNPIWFLSGCEKNNPAPLSGTAIAVPDKATTHPEKKALPENELPIYLLSYYRNDQADWLSYSPEILGGDIKSEKMYMRTFNGELTFLRGLLPDTSIKTKAPVLYQDDLIYGHEDTLYVTSQSYLNKENDSVTQIRNKEIVAEIPMPFSRLGKIYYDPSTKIWYAYGSNEKDKDREQTIIYIAAYQDTELLKLWEFPGVTFHMWPVGDGNGHIYLRLAKETLNENYERIIDKYSYSYDTLKIKGTGEPQLLFEDTDWSRGFYADVINKYVYLLNRSDSERPNDLGLLHNGQLSWYKDAPQSIYNMSGVSNPITGKFYGASPVRLNGEKDNYEERLYGQYPVLSIDNNQPIFHEHLRLDAEEPYPDSISYKFDYSINTMYGFDRKNKFIYVILDTQLIHRFPFSCQEPQGMHVNSITSLIYINCVAEVQVFAYPSLISPETQGQLDELKQTTPAFFKYVDKDK